MSSYRRNCLLTFAGSLALVLCAPAIAQQTADLVSPDQTESTPAPQKATAGQTSSGTSSDADLTDNQWHYYGTGYIWFPGIHGTAGIRGFDASVHVSAGEIFSNFKGGFLGAFTPTYNRFSVPMDLSGSGSKTAKQFRLRLIILCGPHSTSLSPAPKSTT
jgi:hypothetical protein